MKERQSQQGNSTTYQRGRKRTIPFKLGPTENARREAEQRQYMIAVPSMLSRVPCIHNSLLRPPNTLINRAICPRGS